MVGQGKGGGILREIERRTMQGANKERCRELCEQASVEQDPDKLLELVKAINRLLEDKKAPLADKPRNQD